MAYVNLGQVMYPVGAYFFSNNLSSPSSLFGGTWTAVDAGRFICAAGSGYDAGTQGGASSVTLSAAQMPVHSHTIPGTNHGATVENQYGAYPAWIDADKKPNWDTAWSNNAGGNQAHENRPLYRAAYIWRRTA